MFTLSLTDGAVFAERYRIVRCIAAGGMGAVYEVIHLETNRRRALKVMLPHFVQSEELKDRFRQEARVAADIESEFIVDVFDAGVDPQTKMPFLVMELLRGDELGKLLKQRGHFTPAEVVTYLHQAALALDKTHRAHIVHRDLKPENLFLTHREDGAPRLKVLDFGVAKIVAESNTNANATRSLGTPLYMAPEQFRSGHTVSPATDLYALGMVAYTLLVGQAYWAEEARGCNGNVFAFAASVTHGPQERATARAQRAGVALPAAFDAWFAKAAAWSPQDRFPSATALVGALAEALGVQRPRLESLGSHEVAAPPSSTEKLAASRTSLPGLGATKAPPRRRGLAVALVGTIAFALVALGVTVLVLPTHEPAVAIGPAAAPADGAPALVADAAMVPLAAVPVAPAPPQEATDAGAPSAHASPRPPPTLSAAALVSSRPVPSVAQARSSATSPSTAHPVSTSRTPAGTKGSIHVRD
ncbi:serine/threonine-protein kinase [Sorangium sp. So ce216]